MFGGIQTKTSEPLNLAEGYFSYDGKEFIRYVPERQAVYGVLNRAAATLHHVREMLDKASRILESSSKDNDDIRGIAGVHYPKNPYFFL